MAKNEFAELPSGERRFDRPQRSVLRKQVKPATVEEKAVIKVAHRRRAAYETANPDRFEDATKLSPTGMSVGQIYHEMQWGDTGIGPKHYDVQLPGMSDPDAAPRPQKWEELTAEEQSHTHRALSMLGTSVDQMSKDFGDQLDQGYMRAHGHNQEPHAKHFYNPGSEEREVLRTTASRAKVSQAVHSAMNAFTSPNTKFKTTGQPAKGIPSRYPNDEAAEAAETWSAEGRSPESLNSANWKASGEGRRGLTARPANLRKAAHVMDQVRSGTRMADATGPTGLPAFSESSPKTGPYANTWNDTHPQFLVSDVHTGGGGMLPHLGFTKPGRVTKEGEPYIDKATGKQQLGKSEREQAIASVPNFHSAADYAARQAMIPRGLGSVRETQATQWGEEQIRRGGRHGMLESKAYPPDRSRDHKRQVPGQESLF
jgi:hypothetical protein